MGRKHLNKMEDLGEFVEYRNGLCEFKCKICRQILNTKDLDLFVAHVKGHYSTGNFSDAISEFKEGVSCTQHSVISFKKLSLNEIDKNLKLHSPVHPLNERKQLVPKLKIRLKQSPVNKNYEVLDPEIRVNLISDDKNKILEKNTNQNNVTSAYNSDNTMFLSDDDSAFVEEIKLTNCCNILCKSTEKSVEKIENNPCLFNHFWIPSKNDVNHNTSEINFQETKKNYNKNRLHVDLTQISKPTLQNNEKLKGNDNVKHDDETVSFKNNLIKKSLVKEKNENQCSNYELEFAVLNEIESNKKLPKLGKIRDKTQCEICGKYLNAGAGLNLHLMRHNGRSPYKCLVCNRGFYNKYTLASHQQVHNPKKEYKCEHCDKEYNKYVDLKRHIRYSHQKEKPNPVMCDLCGKSFSFAFNLKYHMRRHLNVKPVKCDKCDMTFVERGDLNKHLITHNPDHKPFVCEICSKSFSRKITLTKHQKLHTGLKEYICKICGKAFAQSPGLYMHMKTHGFNIRPEGAGYYERQSHLLFRNMNSDRANFS